MSASSPVAATLNEYYTKQSSSLSLAADVAQLVGAGSYADLFSGSELRARGLERLTQEANKESPLMQGLA